MFNMKRWIGLVGLAILVNMLVIGLMRGMALAQGPNSRPGNSWGPGMMNGQAPGYGGYGYGHHGMTLVPARSAGVNGWDYSSGITSTVPYGYGCGGWGGNSWGGGMMGRPNAWGWSGNHGWGMRSGSWGYFGQQPGNWRRYTPQALPDGDSSPKTREEVSFEADIQPIFNTRCIACHGGTAALYLNSYDNVRYSGVNGPAVIPRDPTNSRLIQYVQRGYMPLGGPPLSQAQTQTLANWVAAGAPNN